MGIRRHRAQLTTEPPPPAPSGTTPWTQTHLHRALISLGQILRCFVIRRDIITGVRPVLPRWHGACKHSIIIPYETPLLLRLIMSTGKSAFLLRPAATGRDKVDYRTSTGPSQRQCGRHLRDRLIAASLLIIAFLWLAHFDAGSSSNSTRSDHARKVQQPTYFDWNTIKAESYLDYTPCYKGLQCARLELPMDWFNQTTISTISLAVIRQPAVVPVIHPQYGGAILLNPGGPGGSGIGYVLSAGEYVRYLVDTDTIQGKYFDIISFDPRGVGFSQPRVDCFHSPNFAANWHQRVQEEGWFESSDAALGRLWSMSTAKGHACSIATDQQNGDDIKKYVSTASHARDMLELVEKHGEWRDREAKSLLTERRSPSPWTRCISRWMLSEPDLPASLRYTPGGEKLQYYGASYGSYLGGTFAAMFPDRVGRLVVDGVIEYNNYLSGNWSSNLVDTEKTMDSFYFHCARAGFPACVLANETVPSSPLEIKERLDRILQSLYHSPLPVYTRESADVLSYSEVRSTIFAALYSPVLRFPVLAHLLLAIEQKDSPRLAPLVQALHPSACSSTDPPSAYATPGDAQVAIACSDADDQSYMDRGTFAAFAKELATVSPSGGSLWSVIRMNCIHYTLSAIHRFKGPWKADTSHPLLFIGNTADPVTPGLYARKMAEGYPGAVTLMQDSGGHCSSAAFSYCTTGHIRRYYQTGELPPANTTCGVDTVPFGSAHEDSLAENGGGKADMRTWEKMAEASSEDKIGIPGGQAWLAMRQVVLG